MRVYRSFATVAPTGVGLSLLLGCFVCFRRQYPRLRLIVLNFALPSGPKRFISPFLPLPSRLRLIVPKEISFRASYPMNADAHDSALKIIFPRIRELGTTEEILGEAENRRQYSAVRLA